MINKQKIKCGIKIEGDSIELLPYHPNNSEELNVVYIPTNREIYN